VIVPARDSERTILRVLSAVAEQQAPGGHEVILVDNGSTDHTARVVEQAGLADRLIRRARGEGPGAARNAGAAAAHGEVLAFIDADCWPAPGWLAAGVAATEAADLVQGRVRPDPAVHAGPFDRTLSVNAAYGLFETANLFVRRDRFESLGGFPAGLERTGAPFGEDVLFGWQAQRSGARTSFCAQALAYHEVRSRTATGFIRERTRLALFPGLAREVPELREAFFYRRVFFSQRSASFDLAAAAVAAGLAAKRPAALAGAAPYLWLVASDARPWGLRSALPVALAGLAADAVGALALIAGSARAGALLV